MPGTPHLDWPDEDDFDANHLLRMREYLLEDVYDPYLDPDTGILVNKVGATKEHQLTALEKRAVFARMCELELRPLEGNFDADHFKRIHGYLFQDVYSWAGKTRLTNMVRSDDTKPFTNAVDIDFQLRARLLQLEDEDYFIGQGPTAFAINAAKLLRDINTIHAFADGNGRTQRVFLRQLAKQAGYNLNWRANGPDREALVTAFNEASRIAHLTGNTEGLIHSSCIAPCAID